MIQTERVLAKAKTLSQIGNILPMFFSTYIYTIYLLRTGILCIMADII